MISSHVQRLKTSNSAANKKTNAASTKKTSAVAQKTTKAVTSQKTVATMTQTSTAVQKPTSKKSTAAQKTTAMQRPTTSKKPPALAAKKTVAVQKPAEAQKSSAKQKTMPAKKTKTTAVKKRRRPPPPGFEIDPDFICDPCALILEDKKHYLQHMLTFHAFRCDCCRKRFLSKYMLQKHISAQLKSFPGGLKSVKMTTREVDFFDKSTPKRYACGKCDEVFGDKDELKQHKTEAHWKYKCTMCDQVLSTPATLEYHMRGHMGVRPFACNQCDQKFTANTVLLKHKATCHPKSPDSPEYAEESTISIIFL